MAVVPLGNIQAQVGQGVQTFNDFPFLQDQAYAIAFEIVPEDEQAIFSYLLFRAFITVPGQPVFYDAETTKIRIIQDLAVVKFACSPLYRGNGFLTPTLERIPFYPRAGDGVTVTITAFYDDAFTVPSWRA